MSNGIYISGPIAERAVSPLFKSSLEKNGGHYNIFAMMGDMASLRAVFPEDKKPDEYNVVLFSTSGIHGSYTTIEEIEHSLRKYGEGIPEGERLPDDWAAELTVLVLHPRTVTLRYGCVHPSLADIEWLKMLRKESWKVLAGIGKA